ncbi:DUF4222 domain-containing protein [Klebsiella aerogenes]|nr:DUF4222 domain-containing protein [Klebsiella aerogenes]
MTLAASVVIYRRPGYEWECVASDESSSAPDSED